MPDRTLVNAAPPPEAPALAPATALDATIRDATSGSAAATTSSLADRYELVALIGWGGMGNVYRAHDRELDEIVAVKMLRGVSTEPAVAQLRQEAKLARRVTHASVVRTFDIGDHAGARFITMEYVDGEPLSARLERERRLALPDLLVIATAMASGLAAAHAVGVVHRDLKPANVLLGADGAKITDFGIARSSDVPLDDGSGTPAYMSPEQLDRFRASGAVDERSDIYSFGLIVFEMLVGRRAFAAASFATARDERKKTPSLDPSAERSDTPRELTSLVRACTAYAAAERPDAEHVRRALTALTSATALAPSPSLRSHAASQHYKPIAVLDVKPLDIASVALAAGFTEDLLAALSRAPTLRLCSRAMVAEHASSPRDPADIAHEVGARAVVTGTLRRDGDHVTAELRLVANDGLLLWGQHIECSRGRLLVWPAEVAKAIASALDDDGLVDLAPAETVDPDAMELYLSARSESRTRFADGAVRAIDLLSRAVEIAPNDARFLAAHAAALTERFRFHTADEDSLAAAKAVAQRAMDLAPTTGEPHLATASIALSIGSMEECARHLRLALRYAPWNGEAHHAIGELLAETGQVEQGITNLREALELDPGLWASRYDLGYVYALNGDFARADVIAETPPDDPRYLNLYWWQRLRVLVWNQDPARLSRAVAFARERTFALRPWVDPFLAGLGGDVDESALATVGELARPRRGSLHGSSYFARVHADLLGRLGRPDAVMAALIAQDNPRFSQITWLDRSPNLVCVRDRPDFAALRERVAARAASFLAAYREDTP